MELEQQYEMRLGMYDSPVLIPSSWDERLARLVSDVFCPPTLAAGSILLTAYSLATPAAWRWALYYLTLVVLVPTLYVVWLLQRGEVTDFHLRVREQRIKPMLVMVVTVISAWLTMWWGGAPDFLLLMAGAGMALMGLIFVVTLRWKISGHAAASSGFFALSWVLMGQTAAPVALLMPVVAWSRVKLRRHTLAQIVAGSIVGPAIFLATLYLTE
jgi:membrane-associated phospholipid phosphatase